MATIKRLEVAGLSTQGSPYSQIVTDGNFAFLAGIVASDVAGGELTHGDLAAETIVVMTAVRQCLEALGLDMSRIVRVDVHITDLRRIREMDDAYRQFFDIDALPARTCTESARLAGGSNVEITVTARHSHS